MHGRGLLELSVVVSVFVVVEVVSLVFVLIVVFVECLDEEVVDEVIPLLIRFRAAQLFLEHALHPFANVLPLPGVQVWFGTEFAVRDGHPALDEVLLDLRSLQRRGLRPLVCGLLDLGPPTGLLVGSGALAGLVLVGPGSLPGGLLGLEHRAEEAIADAFGDLDQFAPRSLVNMGECGELALDLLEGLSPDLCRDGRVLRRPEPYGVLLDALNLRTPLPGAPLGCFAAQELLGLPEGLPVGPLLRSQPAGPLLTVAGDLPVREFSSSVGYLRHRA